MKRQAVMALLLVLAFAGGMLTATNIGPSSFGITGPAEAVDGPSLTITEVKLDRHWNKLKIKAEVSGFTVVPLSEASVTVALQSTQSGESAADVAPVAAKKAGKLRIDGIMWDNAAQEFVISMSLKSGLAKAGERAGFVVSTRLEIRDLDGGWVSGVDPKGDPVRKQAGATKDADGMVSIEPQRIPWDRDGGTFTGPAIVTVFSELRNPGGGTVSGVDPKDTGVTIGKPSDPTPTPPAPVPTQ